MAIEKFTLRVCDICHKPDDVLRCRVDVAGRRGTHADLCSACRKPLERVVDRITEARPGITRVAELPLVSEADIARMGTPAKRRKRPTITAAAGEGTTTP
jgi:hypothetical protein